MNGYGHTVISLGVLLISVGVAPHFDENLDRHDTYTDNSEHRSRGCRITVGGFASGNIQKQSLSLSWFCGSEYVGILASPTYLVLTMASG